MDPFTHALTGAVLARSLTRRADPPNPAGRPGDSLAAWQVLLVITVAAVFPDIDAVFGFVSDIATLTDRRGITHSAVMLPLWALLLGWVFARLLRRQTRFWALAAYAAIGIGLHLVFDLINAFGVMLLAPFSWQRFDWGMTFIIDLGLTGMLLAGLLVTLLLGRRPMARRMALLTCALVVLYLGVQLAAKSVATDLARGYARANSLVTDVAIALPRPLSPFHWTLVVQTPSGYRYAHVDVARRDIPVASADDGFFARIQNVFVPVGAASWIEVSRFGTAGASQAVGAAEVRALWDDPAFAFYREFANLPALFSTSVQQGRPCATFQDLRFVSPGREAQPFRYGICRAAIPGAKPFVYTLDDDGREVGVNRTTRVLF